jgi:Protein of unknown function (DUF642)
MYSNREFARVVNHHDSNTRLDVNGATADRRNTVASVELHQFGGRNLQRIGKSTNIHKSDISLPPLDPAQVASCDAAFQRKPFLRPALSLSAGRQPIPELDFGVPRHLSSDWSDVRNLSHIERRPMSDNYDQVMIDSLRRRVIFLTNKKGTHMLETKGLRFIPLSSALLLAKFTTKSIAAIIPLLGIVAFAGTASAKTNLITNGNFGIGAPPSGCVAGTTTLSGWTVTAGNIDIDSAAPGCSGIAAAPGATYFLDLTGSFAEDGVNDVGAISQTINTVVGQKYSLTFYFGGNPQWQDTSYPNDSPLKAMDVFVNNAIAGVYSTNTAGVSTTDAQWTKEKIAFTATSASTTISFDSLNGSPANPSDFGPLLDDVSVSAVGRMKAPEIDPASAASGLTLMLGGLAVLRGRRKIIGYNSR